MLKPWPLSKCLVYLFLFVDLCQLSAAGEFASNVACGAYRCSGARKDQPCSCDELCSTFGDCCPDYFGSENLSKLNNFIDCWDTRFSASYFVITKCPLMWEDEFVRRMCESENPGLLDEYLIPVKTKSSIISFKNAFCAYCHGHALDEITFWTYTYYCKTNLTIVFSEIVEKASAAQCVIVFTEPEIRRCRPEALGLDVGVSTSVDLLTRKMCYKYIDYVLVNIKLYKNRYCIAPVNNTNTPYVCVGTKVDKFDKRIELSELMMYRQIMSKPKNVTFKQESEGSCVPLRFGSRVYHNRHCYRIFCSANIMSIYTTNCKIRNRIVFKICNIYAVNGDDNVNLKTCYNTDQLFGLPVVTNAKDAIVEIKNLLESKRKYRQLLIFNPNTANHGLENCTSIISEGNPTKLNEKVSEVLERLVNFIAWPWHINITVEIYSVGHQQTYTAGISICTAHPCFVVNLPRAETPNELVHHGNVNGDHVYVCVNDLREYNRKEIEGRNNEIRAFYKRVTKKSQISGVNNMLGVWEAWFFVPNLLIVINLKL